MRGLRMLRTSPPPQVPGKLEEEDEDEGGMATRRGHGAVAVLAGGMSYRPRPPDVHDWSEPVVSHYSYDSMTICMVGIL